ncbi:MAG: acyl-CoA dehydrogenase family protein [Pseudomonadales bacterium]
MSELADFRVETAAWLQENCPTGAKGPGQIAVGSSKVQLEPDTAAWLERMAEKGWTVPTWPKEYGGGGLNSAQARVLYDEMGKLNARAPLGGMGVTMIGPTLLEFGTEAQKAAHLPLIAAGQRQWCQGYSEPNAGSDLAALKTRADDKGDHYVLNGQKIWTSGAATADWMFALVRTDFDASKHDGISFVLLTMDQPGVSVKPIRLLSGTSPFCETFLDDAVAQKEDLVGQAGKGWTIGKRLLQFERSGIGGLSGGSRRGPMNEALVDIARDYVGSTANGQVSDPAVRRTLTEFNMNWAAFRLTAKRVNEETKSGTPGAATSIFKLYGAALQQDGAALKRELMGTDGLGVSLSDWGGSAQASSYSDAQIEAVRDWLGTKATTIYGGSNEIQANIIAKRVLGLPD